MGRRSTARAAALRALFAVDVGKNETDAALRAAFREEPSEGEPQSPEERLDAEGRAFARLLVEGVLGHKEEIDTQIAGLSRDWALDRLAALDRSLLRLGAYELIFRQDETPAAVAINEAVELAKAYSTPESGRFVNGILGALARRGATPAVGAADAAQPPEALGNPGPATEP